MNLRQVRKKIKSISNVKKITKAMELVSGIKMRKAQAVEIEGRPYRMGLREIIEKLAPGVDPSYSKLVTPITNAKKKHLCIFVTSNKGLCGAFHVNLNRFLVRSYDYKESDFITVGKKGAVVLSKLGRPVIADFSTFVFLNEVSAIFNLAIEKFLAGEYSQIDLIYTKFISTLRSEVIVEKLLPVALDFSKEEVKKQEKQDEYLVEPSPNQILDFVLRSYVEDKIRGAIISSEAVEHSARMIAMKNATDNADDVIYNFSLLGNKLRQEKITNELLDMVTAKESVETN